MNTHAHFESDFYSQLTWEMLKPPDSELRILRGS